MNLEFRTPTNNDVEEILTWKYDGIYSFYDNSIDEMKIKFIKSFIGSDNDFSIYSDGRLIGNCSFYYIGEFFCVGLQMRPDITGKGLGLEFAKSVIDFGKQKYNLTYLDLTVAKFNERAIKVYKKLGFTVVEEFVNTIRDNDYDFVAMRLMLDNDTI